MKHICLPCLSHPDTWLGSFKCEAAGILGLLQPAWDAFPLLCRLQGSLLATPSSSSYPSALRCQSHWHVSSQVASYRSVSDVTAGSHSHIPYLSEGPPMSKPLLCTTVEIAEIDMFGKRWKHCDVGEDPGHWVDSVPVGTDTYRQKYEGDKTPEHLWHVLCSGVEGLLMQDPEVPGNRTLQAHYSRQLEKILLPLASPPRRESTPSTTHPK